MNLHQDDLYFLSLAIAEAEKAKLADEVPVGALLVDRTNNIIAKGFNQSIKKCDPTAHAEIIVLQKAGQVAHNYRMPDTTLYVTLEPCPMCAAALVHARVSRVVFAAKDPRTGACGSVFDLHQNDFLNHQYSADFIENQYYIDLLRSFFKEKRIKMNKSRQ